MKHCAHHGRRLCILCAAQTLIFPVEHFLWTQMPGLRALAPLFGL